MTMAIMENIKTGTVTSVIHKIFLHLYVYILKKNTTDPDPDTQIHPANPASPLNSEDTIRVIGEHLPKDFASLFTPPFEGRNIGEEPTERLGQDGSERIFQPGTHYRFSFPHDSKTVKLMSCPLALRKRTRRTSRSHARVRQ